jgi:regulator of replication initiation timing
VGQLNFSTAMQLCVQTCWGETIILNASGSDTIDSITCALKRCQKKCAYKDLELYLTLDGRILDSFSKVNENNITTSSIIKQVIPFRGGRNDLSGSDSDCLDEEESDGSSSYYGEKWLEPNRMVPDESMDFQVSSLGSDQMPSQFERNFPLVASIQHDPPAVRQMWTNTAVPVKVGKKGLCYDVSMVEDERVRARIIKNRVSAAKSRKRKLDQAQELQDSLARRQEENLKLRGENDALRQRISELEQVLRHRRARQWMPAAARQSTPAPPRLHTALPALAELDGIDGAAAFLARAGPHQLSSPLWPE